MAQLKDLLVTGASRLVGDAYVNAIQITTINAPTAAGGATYGAGTNGQVLKTNGTTIYWGADSNSDVNVTQTITTGSANYRLLFSNTADDTTRTETARKAAALYYNPSTKLLTISGGQVTATTFNGYLNGTSTLSKGLTNISDTGITTNGILYAKGQLTIGTSANNATEGSNANYQLWSYPAGGTAINNNTSANIQNIRAYWGTTYFRDIFISPNNSRIYHRAVNNGTAEAWRLLVQANTAGKGSSTIPVYVDTDGNVQTISSYSGNANSATTASYSVTAAFATTASRATTAGNATDATKLPLAGGTMTGGLTLAGAPTADLHAATKKYVDDSLSSMSGPMRFIGTLGSGGTTSSLGAAAAANKGHSYKVITAGTYQSVSAKVGDMLVSNGSSWILIPSGDEPSGTVTNIATGSGLTGGPITTSGTISHATPSGASSGAKGSSTARYYIKTITTDAFGHVTAVTTGNETVTNTDEKVKQLAAITTAGVYPIILANSTATTEVTGTVNKTSTLSYNPNTYALKVNNATIQYNNASGCLEIIV